MGKTINRKTITAGNLVQIIEYSRQLPKDTTRQREGKRKLSSEAKRRSNHRAAKSKLAFLLAANFTPGEDYFVTLTYNNDNLPKGRKEAKLNEQRYFRKIRDQRRLRNQSIKWVSSIESKHIGGRWHHHAVISAADPLRDYDEIKSLWPYGNVEVSRLFDKRHCEKTWFSVAEYLCKERPENGNDITPVGARIFSHSLKMIKPRYVFEIIEDGQPASIPPGAMPVDGIENGDKEYYADGIPIRIRYLTYQLNLHRP